MYNKIMKKSILITGVSGVGKTSLSNKLNKMGYKSYDIDDIPGLFTMIHRETKLPIENHNNADLEKVKVMTWVCNIKKLKSIISDEQNDLAFYCGGGSNVYQMMKLFDGIILLKINLKINKHRLTTRTNNDFARIQEIQDYVMSKKDKWEKIMEEKGAIVIDAHGDLDSVVKEVIEKVKKF